MPFFLFCSIYQHDAAAYDDDNDYDDVDNDDNDDGDWTTIMTIIRLCSDDALLKPNACSYNTSSHVVGKREFHWIPTK